ncbi:Crp/Fnr family transcriptional regulator [Muricoccus radiodurans]|uniref:Crp/Fnr family transcriptional regulator n=1 Tax=Muricoccus radiodurans TaxID=2231721 RepID=UPI003CECD3B6
MQGGSTSAPESLGPAIPPGEPCPTCPARVLGVCGAAGNEGLHRFSRAALRRSHAPQEEIFCQGTPLRHLTNVIEGTIRLSRTLPDGRQQVVGFAQPGSLLGLRSGATHGHSATALTPARTCRVPWPSLEKLLGAYPTMERRLRRIACEELEVAEEHMMTLGRKTAPERVATFLLRLADRAAVRGETGPLSLPMSRADIADHLGLRLETVSRAFSDLQRRHVIRQEGARQVIILDRALLANVAGQHG